MFLLYFLQRDKDFIFIGNKYYYGGEKQWKVMLPQNERNFNAKINARNEIRFNTERLNTVLPKSAS